MSSRADFGQIPVFGIVGGHIDTPAIEFQCDILYMLGGNNQVKEGKCLARVRLKYSVPFHILVEIGFPSACYGHIISATTQIPAYQK